jgi:hypothetical protein
LVPQDGLNRPHQDSTDIGRIGSGGRLNYNVAAVFDEYLALVIQRKQVAASANRLRVVVGRARFGEGVRYIADSEEDLIRLIASAAPRHQLGQFDVGYHFQRG